jgi:starch phosphorylase
MKVLVNGGLNLSELDGWWAEAYTPEVGWAIGDGQDRGEDPSWDAAEAEALYALLEGEVIPAFYTRDARGIPRGWMSRMRESMARLTPKFSANRAVREYTDGYYVPAAVAYRERAANHGQKGTAQVVWRKGLERCWSAVHFKALDVSTAGDRHTFRVQVDLAELDPDGTHVELYADGLDGGAPLRQLMTRLTPLAGTDSQFVYATDVPATRPSRDFTPRLIPFHAGVSVPLEAPFILWYERGH